MTDQDIRERMRAERACTPPGFDARQDALLKRLTAKAPERRAMPLKRPAVLALAFSLLLACGAAGASGYMGLARFWRDVKPEAEELIQEKVAQTGGEMSGASFAVREAVFDGKTVEALIEVRGKGGFMPLDENGEELEALLSETDWAQSQEAKNTLAVGCDVSDVDGVTLSSGTSESMREEDGTLLVYVSDVLERTVEAEQAQITMTCWTYPASNPREIQRAELTFALSVVEREKVACDMSADMEGWLTVTRVETSYTPLSMEAEITYMPGERLKQAMPVFYADDVDRNHFWSELGGQIQNEDGSYTLELICPTARSLPDLLTLRVEGIDSRLNIDFAAGTATVEAEQ
ncbi:MAG: hypothetical protein Q4G52_05795 [Clostridia bacterium]|nr:hypothetical protein [Clostridia bacterium]